MADRDDEPQPVEPQPTQRLMAESQPAAPELAQPGHEPTPPVAAAPPPHDATAELAARAEPRAEPVQAAAEPPPPTPPPAAILPVVEVEALDWDAVRAAVDPSAVRARMRATVERMETLLDQAGGPALLFDDQRANPDDRAIRIDALDESRALWFIGDLHGDLLALEAALALVRQDAAPGGAGPRLVFLGDLFDDGAYGLEVLLRVFELVAADPGSVCLLTGNHDEALGYDGARFLATVSPRDFADFLNAHLAHEWMVRAGKIAVRLYAAAPRALFFPDGLLAAHGGFPLADLHAELRATGDFNHPTALTDFVWARAHPKARRKLPNRNTRGSQFGYEDFAAFCAASADAGRPVTHMVRGHDHVDERYAIYPAYAAHPVLTTVALSRRLPREAYGPYERVPTVARWVHGALPQVHRLHVPPALVRDVFPEPRDEADAGGAPAAPERDSPAPPAAPDAREGRV